MAGLFDKFRAKKTLTFQGESFTLMQPSAYCRTQYLLAVEQCAEEEQQEKNPGKKVDTSNISFKRIAENQKMSLYLIALCLYESLKEKPTFEQCRVELEQFAPDDLVEFLYPHCEELTWPKAPQDALDPKPDQGIDSPTA